MKKIHLSSFMLGLGSGLLALLLVSGGMRLAGGTPSTAAAPGDDRQMRFTNIAPNTAMMAERLNMTEAELQAALDSGKTIQEIAQEKGVELRMGGGMRGRNGSGAVAGSGTVRWPVSQGSSSSSSSAR